MAQCRSRAEPLVITPPETVAMTAAKLAAWWASISTTELIWLMIGFIAQLMFSMRFILQWIASERAKRSIVPEVFWYFSLAGGILLFAYAIYRLDPVFMMGLHSRRRRRARQLTPRAGASRLVSGACQQGRSLS